MRQLFVDNYRIDAPIIEIIRRLQITLTNGKLKDVKEGSDNIVVTCPHHADGKENKAALNIYIGSDEKIEYGYARCFVCDFQGSFVKFVAECFDRSEQYAKDWLIKHFGVLAYKQVSLGEDIKLPGQKEKPKYLDEKVLDQYQSWCPYLAKRRLSREMCENFKVKYDPKYKQVIFPVYDTKGHLVMLPKRSTESKIFYLDSGIEKPVYGLNIIVKNNAKACMVVEGPIDMLSCWTNRVPAIATLGSPSDEQIEQINKSCINILYLAFDNDEAGRKFRDYVKARLSPRILPIEVSWPVGCKDANDVSSEQWEILKNKYNLPLC